MLDILGCLWKAAKIKEITINLLLLCRKKCQIFSLLCFAIGLGPSASGSLKSLEDFVVDPSRQSLLRAYRGGLKNILQAQEQLENAYNF